MCADEKCGKNVTNQITCCLDHATDWQRRKKLGYLYRSDITAQWEKKNIWTKLIQMTSSVYLSCLIIHCDFKVVNFSLIKQSAALYFIIHSKQQRTNNSRNEDKYPANISQILYCNKLVQQVMCSSPDRTHLTQNTVQILDLVESKRWMINLILMLSIAAAHFFSRFVFWLPLRVGQNTRGPRKNI